MEARRWRRNSANSASIAQGRKAHRELLERYTFVPVCRVAYRPTPHKGGAGMPVVLIVEDETHVLILAEAVLEGTGYEVVSAATLTEALAIVDSDHQLDLLFTDLGLGNEIEGGLVVADRATKSRPGLPVLYTSGRELTDGLKALFVEPYGFLAKPYTVEQLTNAHADLLGRTPSATKSSIE